MLNFQQVATLVLLHFVFTTGLWGQLKYEKWYQASCGERTQYIDRSGRVRLNVETQWSRHFHEDLAAVSRAGKWGFINKAGATAIPLQFSEVGDFSNGLASACFGAGSAKSCGFINRQGDEVVPFKHSEVWNSREGILFARTEREIEVFRSNGMREVQLPPGCKPSLFSEGFLPCSIGGQDIIRNLGGLIVPSPPLLQASGFHEGLAAVTLAQGRTPSYIDIKGHLLPVPAHRTHDVFSEGLAAVEIGGRYGYIDKSGRIVIRPQFQIASPFHHGRAAVRFSHLTGFIDRRGKLVIPDVFIEVYSHFDESGLARVLLPPEYGTKGFDPNKDYPPGVVPSSFTVAYVDISGRVIWQCAPEEAGLSKAQ